MRMRPTHRAVIDIGHKCNIGCLHCYNKHETNKGWKSKSEVMSDILKAKDRGNTYIDFTGGETTLYPHMIEVVKFCNEHNLKCCLITNGMTGKNRTEELLKAGVDDWLISTHGAEKDHNVITRCDRSRELQLRFIQQLDDFGATYRFNCCILSYNQYRLSEFADWAVTFKNLRIVNFINFNPHGAWSSDVEGTKKQMADLDTVEEQLNAAIAILRNSEKAVNVRYYPMCRIAPEYRMHVCNDLQVLFDPYEWDYSIMPKTVKQYTQSAVNMSCANEWKAQPCVDCNIRNVCGGINSNFMRASENKNVVHAVHDVEKTSDIYYYRRANKVCLEDRAKAKSMCVCAIADEGMRWYVPLFLFSIAKAFPDLEVKVFARYNKHDRVRQVTDNAIGPGFYDSCVIERLMEEYPQHYRATAAMRFLEFEVDLQEYDSVLWTDIDMLFYGSHDIEKFHREKMECDHTQCYENTATLTDGERLSGVHFITREWWKCTAEARLDEAAKLMKTESPCLHYDELMLNTIVKQSGLPVSPIAHRRDRLHGVHMGDWRYAKTRSIVSAVTIDDEKHLRLLYADIFFTYLIQNCAEGDEHIQAIHIQWAQYYNGAQGKSLVPEYQAQQQAPVQTINPKKRKKFQQKHYKGKIAIYTVCDSAYAWYAPMFARSAMTLVESNEINVIIAVRGDIDPEMSALIKQTSLDERVKIVPLQNDTYNTSGWTTAALRFVTGEELLKNYEYALITDIDIMLMPEEKSIIDQHMMHLDRDCTQCYENWISEYRAGFPRLPGVQFVTKEWWSKTEKAREAALKRLSEKGATDYWYDEVMLGRIVSESGLPFPPTDAKMWRKHGVHIGDWRLNIARKIIVKPNVWECMHIEWMLKQPVMSSVMQECAKRIPTIADVVKVWGRLGK